MTARQFTEEEIALFLDRVRNGDDIETAALAIHTTGRTLYRRVRADSALREQLNAALAQREASRPIASHGTPSRYSHHGCRCRPCTEANTQRHRIWVEQAQTKPIPAGVQHGRYSTYTTYACRCEPCWAAGSAANRQAHERRRMGLMRTRSRRVRQQIPPPSLTIEQAIARGWSTSRIMAELDACYEDVRRARAVLAEAVSA